MNAGKSLLRFLRNLLPSPFTLAVLLTLLSLLAAGIKVAVDLSGATEPVSGGILGGLGEKISQSWYGGFSSSGFLAFALQMMLMLVLGHVLALSRPVQWLVDRVLPLVRDSAGAALLVTLLTVAVGLFNWGLALIFGAILARKVGEYAAKNGIKINYALVGAAGYSGLMVWHGGLSGSAPLKVAEAGHQFMDLCGVVGMDQTVFSTMNLVVSAVLLLVLPLGMYFLAKFSEASVPRLLAPPPKEEKFAESSPAERLDASRLLSLGFGIIVLLVVFWVAVASPILQEKSLSLSFLNPNYINFLLLGLCLIFHPNIRVFLESVGEAIKGASGILIQFPLYAGIMGLLGGSGIIQEVAVFFAHISNSTTFPILTLFSSGAVNFFVPSGGGQWMVQGPVVLKASTDLGVPHGKGIMALAYGDQLTNMMQPFWALPLLGITGLKASDIIPYTLFLMMLGFFVFGSGLLIF